MTIYRRVGGGEKEIMNYDFQGLSEINRLDAEMKSFQRFSRFRPSVKISHVWKNFVSAS